MKSILLLALWLPIAVAACAPTTTDTGADKDTCGAVPLQNLVGSPATSVTSLKRENLVRVIAPGQMVTQDYQPERINVVTDAKGTVVRISCG